ncbi:MAG: PASTA domain-containing protein, partial [Steroidobacteraceae bacterium]
MKTLSIWAATACLVLTISGCGGDDGSAAPVSAPNVVADTQAAATTAIKDAGLTLGTVTMQSSNSVALGDVISESPAAGTSVAKGAAVNLVISSGPATVAVPNVAGDTQAAATTAITGAGLKVGTVTQGFSSTLSAGSVMSLNPAAGTAVAPGSVVNLVVSSTFAALSATMVSPRAGHTAT